ncbi:DUF2812 domain-containing protein [Clostridium sp.]|uniref:DUF2812 domain-containing protein n=1 Tax=Clostridium sp. TaxID=1506 RepID=UPI003216F5B7
MAKTTYRVKPGNYWKIGVNESWLSDMSSKGLHLDKLGRNFVKFNKGEPKNMYYRIEVGLNKNELSNEQFETYKQYGWNHVDNHDKFHVFSSPYEVNTCELHLLTDDHASMLKPFYKKLILNMLGTLAVILFWFIILPEFLSKNFYSNLLTMSGIDLLSIFTLLYAFLRIISETISIARLRKSLLQGTPIDHHANWKLSHCGSLISTGLFMALCISLIYNSLSHIYSDDFITLKASTPSLPIVRLSYIEDNPKYTQSTSPGSSDVDFGNYYDHSKTIFAPDIYETYESGCVPGEKWGNGELYTPTLMTMVYKVRFSFMADDSLYQLMDEFEEILDSDLEYVKVENENFDILMVLEEKDVCRIFANRGKGIMRVNYYGNADKEKVIDEISKKLSIIEE